MTRNPVPSDVIAQDKIKAIEAAWLKLGPVGAVLKWDWDEGVWEVLCQEHGVLGRYIQDNLDPALWCRLHHNEQLHHNE